MADTKISALAAAAAALAAMEFPVNDAGTTEKVTITQLMTFIFASPTLTGNPLGPTPAADDNDTSIATTAYVIGQMATQAEIETGTSTTKAVTAGRAQFHPSAAKCWGATTGAGVPVLTAGSYNVTSITDTAVGRLTVTIGTDFSSASWVGTVTTTGATAVCDMTHLVTKAAGTVILEALSATTTLADPGTGYDWAFYGDFA
jgi:hypothetical protein